MTVVIAWRGHRARHQSGALMIEILVTRAVTDTGLLGMLGLQVRLQLSEMEAYQRTQALLLLDDMSQRIATNRTHASLYVTDAVLGIGAGRCPDPGSVTDLVDRDKASWCMALQGAAEAAGEQRVGTLLAGRGCVQAVGEEADEYLVTVVWQGAVAVASPPEEISCGRHLYDQPGDSECSRRAGACHRYVTRTVYIADLGDG